MLRNVFNSGRWPFGAFIVAAALFPAISFAQAPSEPSTENSEPASGDQTLPIGSWRLQSLGGEEVDPKIEAVVSFNADGSINGNGGCNTFGSQAILTPTGLNIHLGFSTMMACSPEIHGVEDTLFEAFEQTRSHKVDETVLHLLGKNGEQLASLALIGSDPLAAIPEKQAPEIEDGAVLFRNVRIFDGKSPDLSQPSDVLVQGNKIATISPDPIDIGGADVTVIEGDERVLMPGLIDAHWHPMFVGIPPDTNIDMGFANIVAVVEAKAALMRGFTTVRDLGGPSFGLKRAIDIGLVPGPRIYPSGAMLTVTSGHGDFRSIADLPRHFGELTRMEREGMAIVTDSPDEVRTRVREQLMQGASQVKLTAGGGVASPFSPIDVSTFTQDELHAAVEAAENWGTYVAVHAYTPAAIQGAIRAGVKVIEHGHLMDEETAKMIADQGIWLSIQPFDDHSGAGLDENSLQKLQQVLTGTDHAYNLARKYHIKTAFGTDVLFSSVLAKGQGAFLARLQNWYTPAEALAMATGTNGQLLLLSGKRNPYPGRIGLVEENAFADLLLVDGNPLENLDLVADAASNFLVIMKDGVIYKNTLSDEP